MGDRTYASFTIPVAAVSEPHKRAALAGALGVTEEALASALTREPSPDERTWDNETVVRTVDGCACFVCERSECNYGGSSIEAALQEACIPYIQANASGGEYEPSSTVLFGDETESIRLDECLRPVVEVDLDGSEARVAPEHLSACTRYLRLRARVLALRLPMAAAPQR